jgi:hypothetical protein
LVLLTKFYQLSRFMSSKGRLTLIDVLGYEILEGRGFQSLSVLTPASCQPFVNYGINRTINT